MKKLFLLTLSLFAMMGSAWADHWTVNYTPSVEDPQTETYVYAILQLPAAGGTGWTNYFVDGTSDSNYEIAAFMDDEVRAVLTAPTDDNPAVTTNAETSLWKFRVVGGVSEKEQIITFKVYNTTTRNEYEVNATVNFDDEDVEYKPSNPLLIQLSEPTSLTLSDFTLNVGETKDLLSVITTVPEGAAMPTNLEWLRIPDQYSITDNVLTALQPAKYGVPLNLQAGSFFTNSTVTILQPATSLTLNGANEITVNVGESETLNTLLLDCYDLQPTNTTDVVTWTSADPRIVEVTEGGTYANPLAPGDVVLTGTAGSHSIQVTVHVVRPVVSVNSMFTDENYLECSVGDDLTPYLIDGQAFSILPDDATNKAVTFAVGNDYADDIVTIANGKIMAAKAGSTALVVTSQDNEDARCLLYINVHDDYQTVSFVNNPLPIMIEHPGMDIGRQLASNIVFGPEDATGFYDGRVQVQSDNSEVVMVGDVLVMTPSVDIMANAMQEGTATITVTFAKKDYLKATFTPSQSFITEVTGSFDVEVSQGLSGISVELPSTMLVDSDDEVLFQVFPEPEGIELNPENISYEILYVDDFSGWTPIEPESDWEWDPESGSCVMSVIPTAPITFQVTVNYDDEENNIHLQTTTDPYSIGVNYEFTEGWAWRNFYFGDLYETDLSSLFETGLEEIRTENEEMLNDPVYGFFGDLDLLAQNRCFKVLMSENNTTPMYSGYLDTECTTSIHPGWNWIPNPFFYKRGLNEIFNEGFMPTDGDRIMSKDFGFAEYFGGQWVGSLTGTERGQGYLYFSFNPDNVTMSFADESTMPDEDTALPPGGRAYGDMTGRHAARRVAAHTAYSYDPSRFRDNMGIVAELSDVQRPEDYSVVAFVNDECRGEGQCVNGKMFITVHAKAGEQITFRLVNNLTGESYDVDQTVRFGAMAGSMKAPFRMSSQAVVTGVKTIKSESFNTESYDLGGRAVNDSAKGMTIQRMSDGTFRKVVK